MIVMSVELWDNSRDNCHPLSCLSFLGKEREKEREKKKERKRKENERKKKGGKKERKIKVLCVIYL